MVRVHVMGFIVHDLPGRVIRSVKNGIVSLFKEILFRMFLRELAMTPQELIWCAIGRPTDRPEKEIEEDVCFICGVHSGTIRKADTISSGFTNWDRCSNTVSKAVCLPCYSVMKYKEGKVPKLRQSSWVATMDSITWLQRGDIAEQLFAANILMPFCFYVTTSFKKLGHLKVALNYDQSRFTVQFEEISVQFDREAHRELYDTMRLFYSMPAGEEEKKQPKSFFTKEEIRTGNYQPHRIREFGIAEWREKDAIIAQFRGDPVLDLLLWSLNQEALGRERIVFEKPARKGEKLGKTKKGAGEKRPVPDRDANNICCLACDRLGQYLLFSEDEDI